MIERADIEAARDRIVPWVRKTPVLSVDGAALGLDVPVSLKLEQLQHTGSFKVRGAFNSILSSEVPQAGIVAISGGNHGAAVAYAATSNGASSRVFVPVALAKETKIARMRQFGATVDIVEGDVEAAFAAFDLYAKDAGALAIHPFEGQLTLAGQGTLGLEIEEQLPDLDTLFVSVGGGGLLGGIAAWYGGRINVVAVETEGTATLDQTLHNGLTNGYAAKGLAASALGASYIGPETVDIVRQHSLRNIVVSDADVIEAQRRLWAATRVIGEPGAAAALAAVTSGAYAVAPGERIGVLVCGGNAEPDWFCG